MKKETGYFKFSTLQIVFLGILLFFYIKVNAQETSKEFKQKNIPLMIDSARLNLGPFQQKDSSFIYRFLHPFQKSRFKKEQDRVESLINKYLKVDPKTVEQISEELVRIIYNQAYFEEYNYKNREELNSADKDIKAELEKLRRATYIEDESQKQEMEALSEDLTSLLKVSQDNLNKEKTEIKDEIRKKMDNLWKVHFRCDSNSVNRPESKINDTTFLCLNNKVKVFGWHSSNLDPEVINGYRFNTLTDIIYSDYTLSVNSKGKLTKYPKILPKDCSLVSETIMNGINLSISIYSYSESDITAFLNNKTSQNELIQTIRVLYDIDQINGANIYFQNLPTNQSNNFVEFVSRLKATFSKDEDFSISLSLPAIIEVNNSSKAFDIKALNPLVDYFLIQTEQIKQLEADIPGPPSPLYSTDRSEEGSIEGSLDYYLAANIPSNKLVMTVTYSGLIWNETDGESVERIGMIKIRDYFKVPENSEKLLFSGYDPVQESPYFNYYVNGKIQQLWYEDDISLYKKYNYLLERDLAGVAIWDLGTEDNNLSLWNSMGAALVYVDTVYRSPLPKSNLFNYATLYFSDLMWAAPNDIEIDTLANSLERQKEIDRERYCMWDLFKTNDRLYSSFLKDSTKLTSDDLVDLGVKRNTILTAEDSSRLLDTRTDIIDYLIKMRKVDGKDLYNINNPNFVKVYSQSFKNYLPWVKYETFVDSAEHCTCLAIRWENYAQLHLKISIGFLFASLLIFAFVFYKTMRRGEEGFPNKALIQNIAIVLFLVSVLVFLGYLYFDIHFTYFGAASDDVPIWVLALILIFGFGLGAVYRKIIMERKYAKRDLP